MKPGAVGLLAALIVVSASGCSAPTALPAGVQVELRQSRTDLAVRGLQVSVLNESAVDLTLTALEFDSTMVQSPARWTRAPAHIPSGQAADLPVLLPAPECSAGGIRSTVFLAFELPDGSAGTARLVPVDRFERLPDLHLEDCLAETVAAVVAITAQTPPRVRQVGEMSVADLDLTLTPTGQTGTATIATSRGTTLLAAADPGTGEVLAERMIGVDVDGRGDPATLTLTFVPGRCDAHAIAEDKRGTVLPLDVTTGGGSTGTVYAAATPPVRAALYDFVTAACAPR